ncbi:MAG TPA: 2-dehydropantoate 2-reductase [Sphingomicrobium sp.]|nr:2-dehydropantoate 2-reductase [Sphingomicrobium sp.]
MAAARIAILGAGSVGCFIGGCWQAAGLPVSFIGRPRFASEIAEHGLTVSDFSGWQRRLDEVDYHIDPAPLAEADIIALCVKSGATEGAARDIAEHGRAGALVISFQNGIRNFDVLSHGMGGRFELARGLVSYNIAYLGHGRFHKGVAGELWAEDLPWTRALAEGVEGSPAQLRLSADMPGLAWGKLLINLNNAVNALSGRTLLEELRQRDYRRVVAACQREGLDLLKAAGIAPAKVGAANPRLLPRLIGAPDWLFNSILLKKWKIDARARSSMADDLAAGHRTEVDYINGELVALAERLGVDAPVNRRIVELIRAAEAGAKPMAPAELRQAVLG